MKIVIRPGEHIVLILPDGTELNIEQTDDDFSIVDSQGMVIYEKDSR